MSYARGGALRALTALAVAGLAAACAGGVEGAAGRSAVTTPTSTLPATPDSTAGASRATTTAGSSIPVPPTSTASSSGVGSTVAPATSAEVDPPSPPPSSPPSVRSIADRFADALDGLRVLRHGTPVPVGVRDRVARLALLLGRTPDPDTVVLRTELVVADARTIEQLADEVLRSAEYAEREPVPSDDGAFVDALYRDVLGRDGSAAETATWTAALAAGEERAAVAVAFTDSAEAIRRTGTAPPADVAVAVEGVSRSSSDEVLRLYLGLLRRFPTTAELEQSVERRSDVSLVGVAVDLMSSEEYARRRPNHTELATIEGLYVDLLGRPPDPAGRISWLGQLIDGRSAADIAVDISRSPEAAQRTLTTTGEDIGEAPGVEEPVDEPDVGAPDVGVLAIGDSIMLSAATPLRAAVPGISVNARESRQFTEGLAIVEALAESGDLPRTVIVHLGTNGLVTSESCAEMMGRLPGRRVLLVNVSVPRSWEAATNEALAGCAARFDAELVDWSAVADDSVLASDGYHLSSDGYDVFATTIAAAL